tara:strand:- start:12033 stop:12752 length:720 start_codon:yes stop_codon:yes gene_type:complete
MNKKFITWAIIPARSGSKGIKHKNIIPFLKKPLLAHSINFAKKLKFIDKVILSTDSEKYKKIGKKFGAEVPFLRSKNASKSNSMEEDVLEDIRLKLIKENGDLPDFVLWLRPTHPLRDVSLFEKAYLKFKRYKESVCIVSRTDPRIFISKENKLIPLNLNFKKKSMVRRQDCNQAFKIFHGEFFIFPKKYNKKFLGENVRYEVQNDICNIDIDTEEEIILYQKIIELNKKKYERFLHTT